MLEEVKKSGKRFMCTSHEHCVICIQISTSARGWEPENGNGVQEKFPEKKEWRSDVRAESTIMKR